MVDKIWYSNVEVSTVTSQQAASGSNLQVGQGPFSSPTGQTYANNVNWLLWSARGHLSLFISIDID